MDGQSIGIHPAAMKAAAYARDQVGGYGDSIGSHSEATLSGLMHDSDELLGLLAELGSRLERVESVIAGPVPAPAEASGSKGPPAPSCITDVLDERLSRARMMVSRFHNTVSRIERRIG